MIAIERLTKRFEDGTLSLDALSLRVRAGEVCALLGANGAGKSTTINILLGLLPPTSGSARINGFDVVREPTLARKHVGYIPEQVALYDDLSPLENVRFFVELSGHRCSLQECRDALRSVEFPEAALKRRVRFLSKGMRQKVAIAAQRQKQPQALLLDEPTSGLDPRAAAEFLASLEVLKAAGCAILMATHDLMRVRNFADRVAILDQGRVVVRAAQPELRHVDLEQLYLEHVSKPSPATPQPDRKLGYRVSAVSPPRPAGPILDRN